MIDISVYAYCSEYNRKGIVYFIRDGIGHIKIGVTHNIKNRLLTLQTANPLRLQYYVGLSVPSITKAYEIERYLHEMFSDCRLCGEWFDEKKVIEFLNKETCELCGYTFNLEGIE